MDLTRLWGLSFAFVCLAALLAAFDDMLDQGVDMFFVKGRSQFFLLLRGARYGLFHLGARIQAGQKATYCRQPNIITEMDVCLDIAVSVSDVPRIPFPDALTVHLDGSVCCSLRLVSVGL